MLIKAIPTIDGNEIQGIGGAVPDMRNVPLGCSFNPRCPDATDKCKNYEPRNGGSRRRPFCLLLPYTVMKNVNSNKTTD